MIAQDRLEELRKRAEERQQREANFNIETTLDKLEELKEKFENCISEAKQIRAEIPRSQYDINWQWINEIEQSINGNYSLNSAINVLYDD